MKVVNSDAAEIGEEPVVNSRYSIVLASARRARQIIAGAEPYVAKPKCDKPLSIAVEELYYGQVRILSEDEAKQLDESKKIKAESENTEQVENNSVEVDNNEIIENL